MNYLKTYLTKIKNEGNIELAKSIEKTSYDIGKKYFENFSFDSNEVGLLFGNIQSGKTAQMFGVLCEAADLCFNTFIILTTDNTALQDQTLKRVKNDLRGFCICGENDSKTFVDNALVDPTIVVLKKNSRVLKLWSNIFNSTQFMKGNPLFIIDDEGDAASLNTKINQNGQSTINRYLQSIVDRSLSSMYLQVTGTPQALLLQSNQSDFRPYFSYYFEPGDNYLGGDFFFPNTGMPKCIVDIDNIENDLNALVIRHLAVSGQILGTGGEVSNCLIHPSSRQSIHSEFEKSIGKEVEWCRDNFDGLFKDKLKEEYREIIPSLSTRLSFDELHAQIKEILFKDVKIIVMNSVHETDIKDFTNGCNFIIGGNSLGRGVTFPMLQTIYYSRTSKQPQADTIWQHSRMFGYDRDPSLMRVFLDEKLYKLFSDINATNNSIVTQIKHGLDDIKVYYPKGIKPTRNNVLDKKVVEYISGGTNYFPQNPDNRRYTELTKIVNRFDEKIEHYSVNLNLIKKIFEYIIPSSDFKQEAFLSVIDSMLAEKPGQQAILIVRRNREITQGTGALLSSNDWKLGEKFKDKVVLTLYQVAGTKGGWKKNNLWVPNIKLPENLIYYNVQ